MPISRAKARPEQVESAQSTCELGGLFPVMQVQQPDALHGVKDGKDQAHRDHLAQSEWVHAEA